MTSSRSVGVFTALAGVLLVSCAGPDGRSATSDSAAAEPAGGAVTLWTDSTELFMEHPALIVGAPDKFAVHLTDLSDFAPLRSGRITLRFVPRDGGDPVSVVQDAPRAPGIYGPSPSFTRPGVYDLSILVDSPQAKDSLFVPGLRVYASAAEAPKESGGDEGSTIAFLKEQQWKTDGFCTAFADSGEVAGSITASGMIEPQAGRYAVVSAPLPGLVDAGALAGAPAPGQRVVRGQLLAVLNPSLGEGGSAAIAEARARLREAEDEHERATRLYAVEAIPQRRVHEAEIRVQAAREALRSYGTIDGGRVQVRAPIGGVVTERRVVAGTRVEAGAPLYTIVDPTAVWLRVNVPAAEAPRLSRSTTVEFTVEGSARSWRATRVISIGSVIDSVSRTIPLLLELSNRDGALKVGALARVSVHAGGSERGVVIPLSAIVDEDGQAIAYVQPDGESFERRVLTLGAQQGGRVRVVRGIAAGDRVVTGAAYQVRLASLSTSVPTHGHEH